MSLATEFLYQQLLFTFVICYPFIKVNSVENLVTNPSYNHLKCFRSRC